MGNMIFPSSFKLSFSSIPACFFVAVVLFSFFSDSQELREPSYWAFSLISFLMLRSVLWSNFSWFYLFVVSFFSLGNWTKVSIHHMFDYEYIEPIGRFIGSRAEWESYYINASTMGVTIIFVKLISFVLLNRNLSAKDYQFEKSKLGLLKYKPVENTEWFFLISMAAIFYFFNNHFGFFVTGVDSKLVLPFSLNAPLAFMALIGIPLIFSLFVSRDVNAKGYLDIRAAFAVLCMSLFASISMASRAAVVMQIVPIFLAAVFVQYSMRVRRSSFKPFLLFLLFLIMVLVFVSIYRINLYTDHSVSDWDSLKFYAFESALLVVDRWVGAEAIMVAVAEPSRSLSLFYSLLTESSRQGVDSIYQKLSGSRYVFLDGLTFLTLPGYFGVLALSGSLVFISISLFLLVMSGVLLEKMFNHFFLGQHIPVALISAALANSITQMSFPHLLLPFVFQAVLLALLLRYYRTVLSNLR